METPRDKSIGAQMHLASQLLKRRMHQRIHKLGYKVTMEQLSVLEVLKFHGAMNMSELARQTLKENAVITRMTDILEREGFVQRKTSTTDRRAWEIHITESGSEIFGHLIPELVTELNESTSCLTQKEYDEGLRIMKKIIKHNQGF